MRVTTRSRRSTFLSNINQLNTRRMSGGSGLLVTTESSLTSQSHPSVSFEISIFVSHLHFIRFKVNVILRTSSTSGQSDDSKIAPTAPGPVQQHQGCLSPVNENVGELNIS